ncbi:MAG TPA: glycoside hydrolase family 31 protein [Firmicutes bacterium]|jgi:alpha-glucosidase|nr:glycoside hydrolase family 31 protein [Bacillota bacterium]
MNLGQIISWRQDDRAVLFRCASGATGRIDFIMPQIVRIRATQKERFPTAVLHKYGFIAEQIAGPPFAVAARESEGRLEVGADALQVKIHQETGQLAFYDAQGQCLLQGTDNGVQLEPAGYVVRFNITPDEKFYGFGDQNREQLEHRGTKPRMWIVNVKRYIPIPFFMSSKGYGLFVNTTRDIAFDLGATDSEQLAFSSPGSCVDIYVMAGSGMPELLDLYTRLTGRPVLPPKWSFGLWFICRQQANDHEVITDAHNMRKEGVPCDVIGLEPGWMKVYYDASTQKDWHSERFPRPKWEHLKPYTFTSALKRMGFKLELWECNDYDLSYEAERMAAKRAETNVYAGHPEEEEQLYQGYLEPDEHLSRPRRLDKITIPEEPWFEHHKKFIDQGVDFFKQDGAYQVLEHPDRLWGNQMTDAQMHNLYPLLYSQQMYEGFKEYTGRRPCCFTPAGWAGLQRYTGTWTGDTGGKKETLVACQNLALSGHHLVTCDMDVTIAEGIHYGFLLPWATVNSFNYWRHPWLLGEDLAPIFKDYARLRSRLIPYIYSCAYEAHLTGMPMMRPMVLAFPEEQAGHGYKYQYMLGPSLLVGAFTHELHLPTGEWYDYWNGQKYSGGRTISYNPPENRGGALFVRAGTLLPTQPVQPYVGADKSRALIIEVFPGAQGSFTLFDDDGVSMEFEQGMYGRTELRMQGDEHGLVIRIGERKGSYTNQPERIPTTLRVLSEKRPRRVLKDNQELAAGAWRHDGRYLTIELGDVPQAGCTCSIGWS